MRAAAHRSQTTHRPHGRLFHTPAPADTPGAFCTLPPSGRYPAPEKSPGICRRGT
nr:MAG TPA: hypothetical protein [Bacteriophage sp.]